MKKYFAFGLALGLLAASFVEPAHAESITYSCKRFQSKCSGEQCDQYAEGIMRDTQKKLLAAKKTETVHYKIDSAQAIETLRSAQAVYSADRQMTVTYKNIASENNVLTLSNMDAQKQVREKVAINLQNGFYSYYAIHTDGSIKDVPIGQPYFAYFGWCLTGTQAPAAPEQPTPAAPAAASPAP